MKKLAIIFTIAFLVNSTVYGRILMCLSSGQAYYNDNGTWSGGGGCSGGPWAINVNFVAPTHNPDVPEASEALYSALNALDASLQPTEDEKTEFQSLLDDENTSITTVWVNPLKLNSSAYSIIYGRQTDLPIFYVEESLNTTTTDNSLTLYSNADRQITVVYKALDMTVISSENIDVEAGYNSKNLNTTSLSNGSYIITVSSSSSYAVNLNLAVSH